MWSQLLVRALLGGVIVSVFALLADTLRPKSFAGLFSAAPSVALSSLALTFHSDGAAYVAAEARSMTAGALAFVVYAAMVCLVLRRGRYSVGRAVSALIVVWFAGALGVWWVVSNATPF